MICINALIWKNKDLMNQLGIQLGTADLQRNLQITRTHGFVTRGPVAGSGQNGGRGGGGEEGRQTYMPSFSHQLLLLKKNKCAFKLICPLAYYNTVGIEIMFNCIHSLTDACARACLCLFPINVHSHSYSHWHIIIGNVWSRGCSNSEDKCTCTSWLCLSKYVCKI